MIRYLTRKLAERHHCRNTALRVYAEKATGYGPQVIVEIVDKCTGAKYEAAFTLKTAERLGRALDDATRQAEMGA